MGYQYFNGSYVGGEEAFQRGDGTTYTSINGSTRECYADAENRARMEREARERLEQADRQRREVEERTRRQYYGP